MFLVWGSKHRAEDAGVVADWCDSCGVAQPQQLTDHYQVSHVYYIPLGRGTLKVTSRKCLGCGAETVCEKHSYAHIIPSMEASGRLLDDVLALTNPNLAHRLQERNELELRLELRAEQQQRQALQGEIGTSSVAGGAVAVIGGVADPQMLEALRSLREFDVRNEEVGQFLSQLRRWDMLTGPEQAVLLTEIASYTGREKAIRRTVEFLRTLPNAQPAWVGTAAFFLFCTAIIVGFNVLPFLASWLWGTLFVLATIIGSFMGYSRVSGNFIRRWVRTVLIPRGRSAQIDFNLFVGLLAGVKEAKGDVDTKIKNFASDVEIMADELNQYGMLKLEEDAVPNSSL